jgi:hypothetical protein
MRGGLNLFHPVFGRRNLFREPGDGRPAVRWVRRTCATNSSQPLPLHVEKFGQPRRIGAEPVPCRAKLPHAILAVFAIALGVYVTHGDHGIDAPRPTVKLNADRTDLDLVAITNDNPVIVVRLRMDHFAQEQVHESAPISKIAKANMQWRVPGIRGGVNPSLGLQLGRGIPAPPQPQA